MANLLAIHSIGESLVSYFGHAYQALPREQKDELLSGSDPVFSLLSSKEMGGGPTSTDPTTSRPALTLYLYRVTMNEHLRNQPYTGGSSDEPPPLALDLHYLLTAYGAEELHAEILLGYGMQLLHETPVLTRDAIRRSLAPRAAQVLTARSAAARSAAFGVGARSGFAGRAGGGLQAPSAKAIEHRAVCVAEEDDADLVEIPRSR